MKFPFGKPTFFDSVEALRVDLRPEFAHIHPTADELDAADALELLHQHHIGDAEAESPDGSWGTCTGCADLWPCKAWLWGQQLAIQWMGRAQSRYAAGRAHILGEPTRDLTPPAPLPSRRSQIDIVVESERRRLHELRAVPVTPVYCRHPDCRTTVSVPHPLQPGYLHDSVCAAHQDSTTDRYSYESWDSA